MNHSRDVAKHVPFTMSYLATCTHVSVIYFFYVCLVKYQCFACVPGLLKQLKLSGSILENVSKECCSSLPPVKPKGGEIYVYLNEFDKSKKGKSIVSYSSEAWEDILL